MNLTESQLFTIEALNRIDGFVWPEGAKFAAMDNCVSCVDFYINKVILHDCALHFTGKRSHLKPVQIGYIHPDWRNSLITREQFDSVDGWVRLSTGLANPSVMIEGKTVDGVDYWRYVRNEVEYKQPEEKQPSIEELYEKYQTSASDLIDAQMQVDYLKKQSEEALAEIKKWHQERGFSVSVIGEGVSTHVHNGELNITDWRDLRVGDVVLVNSVFKGGNESYKFALGKDGVVLEVGNPGAQSLLVLVSGYKLKIDGFKFIRRP